MLHVRYARDMWRTNRLCIQIRLEILCNFHVQTIFIRVTDYFLHFFKDLNNILELLDFISISKINGNWLGAPGAVHPAVHTEAGSGPSQLTSQ